MRRLLVALVVTSCSVASLQAAAKKPAAWTPELMMKVKDIPFVQPSPDGKRVAYTVRAAVMEGTKSDYLTHIYIADSDGGNGSQLTQGDKSCEQPQWSPDGEHIAFVSSRSGKANVWLIHIRGGEAWRLTDVESGVTSFKWAPDGKSIAFTAVDPPTKEEEKAAKEKNDARVVDANHKMTRLYVIAVAQNEDAKRQARKLTTGNYTIRSLLREDLGPYDWSPDSKQIAFAHSPTPKADDWSKTDISVVDVATGTVKPLVASNAAENVPRYSPDGRLIAFMRSDDPPSWGFSFSICVVPVSGGEPRELADSFDRYPHLIGWSADGGKLYYTEAHGTVTRLCALPLDGKAEVIYEPKGLIGSAQLNFRRTHASFPVQRVDRPAEAHASPLEHFTPVAVSRVNRDLVLPPVGRTEVHRWKSPDGREIEGLLTLPGDYQKGKRCPLILIVHGGPMGVFSQNYVGVPSASGPLAAFAAHGYAVLRPNPRGSGGYGKDFRFANLKDWGGGDYRDLMAGVDHVVAQGIADPDRLGVMGWSYGGFMTSWIITQTPRFKAASVGAGVTNLVSFTGTSDIPSFLPFYFGGEFWDDLDVYRKHSAMFNVKGVRTPTLILHGEKDERVPISQGYELYNALKRQGCVTQMVVYPRTPHGPSEPKLLLDVLKRDLAWFDKYVKNDGAEARAPAPATSDGPKANR